MLGVRLDPRSDAGAAMSAFNKLSALLHDLAAAVRQRRAVFERYYGLPRPYEGAVYACAEHEREWHAACARHDDAVKALEAYALSLEVDHAAE